MAHPVFQRKVSDFIGFSFFVLLFFQRNERVEFLGSFVEKPVGNFYVSSFPVTTSMPFTPSIFVLFKSPWEVLTGFIDEKTRALLSYDIWKVLSCHTGKEDIEKEMTGIKTQLGRFPRVTFIIQKELNWRQRQLLNLSKTHLSYKIRRRKLPKLPQVSTFSSLLNHSEEYGSSTEA